MLENKGLIESMLKALPVFANENLAQFSKPALYLIVPPYKDDSVSKYKVGCRALAKLMAMDLDESEPMCERTIQAYICMAEDRASSVPDRLKITTVAVVKCAGVVWHEQCQRQEQFSERS